MPRPARQASSSAAAVPAPISRTADVHALAEIEREMIRDALQRARGNKSRAAAALGLSRTRLYTRLYRLGLADEGLRTLP